MERLVLWSGVQEWRAEASRVDLRSHGVAATGTQLGVEPVPYRLDYHLDAPDEFVTKQLQVEVAGEGWRRRIDLRRDPNGAWSCEAGADGEVDLPPPGGSVEGLGEALDCDLGLSPMTNLMPIRRCSLHERSRSFDFLMAWISVPDLGLHPSQQRYEHVSRDEQGAIVRYVGAHREYVGELELDTDGLVLHYPELARRVGNGPA